MELNNTYIAEVHPMILKWMSVIMLREYIGNFVIYLKINELYLDMISQYSKYFVK